MTSASRGGVEIWWPPRNLGSYSVLNDPAKRKNAAQILGQAYVTAENFIKANREHIEAMAGEIIRKREIYGDELVRLLERQHFVKPELDYGNDATWPKM